jgi:hypothetical protein
MASLKSRTKLANVPGRVLQRGVGYINSNRQLKHRCHIAHASGLFLERNGCGRRLLDQRRVALRDFIQLRDGRGSERWKTQMRQGTASETGKRRAGTARAVNGVYGN